MISWSGMGRDRSTSSNRTPQQPPFELDIERLVWGGKGLGRQEGKVIFVPKAVPGDRALVEVVRERTNFAEARLLSVTRPGPGRVDPGCPWFEACGGCQWLAASYPIQVAQKEAMLQGALRHHHVGLRLEPLFPASPALGYRHRGDLHVRHDGERTRLGFFEEGTHRLVEISGCLLFGTEFHDVLEKLRSALSGRAAPKFLERLTIAHSEDRPDRFVAHGRMGPAAEGEFATSLVNELMACGLEGVVLTERGRVLAASGSPHIWFGVPSAGGDLRLRADVRSFTQAHFAMNRELVRTALEWMDLNGSERVLDLFSGVGNFSLPLARSCREVAAVEGSPTACADARFNAEANQVSNLRHREGPVGRVVADLSETGERFDAVLLDPPRTGARECLEGLVRLEPSRILYVSCNLPSVERDIGVLRSLGYRPIRVRGFDCFPQTYGLETLCLLSRE